MRITKSQKVAVAKDRAINEIASVVGVRKGYHQLDRTEKKRIKDVAQFLFMNDSAIEAFDEAVKLGFIKGDEKEFLAHGLPKI